MFLYTLPRSAMQVPLPDWPAGVGSIPANLPDGTPVMLPVLPSVNILTFGTVGTGKTRSIAGPAAEAILNANPETKGVFFECKRSFLDHFYRPGDKIITHDPGAVPAEALFIPNIIREVRRSQDHESAMRSFADFVFADLLKGAGQNRVWCEAARNTFIAVMRVIIDCYPSENTTNRVLIRAIQQYDLHQLLKYLAKHPANHPLLKNSWNFDPQHPDKYTPTRRAEDIRFYLSTACELFSGSFLMDGQDTLHDWLYGQYGRNLFFLYDLTASEISRPIFLFYLKKIKDYKMSNSGQTAAPILMVMDEIDKMSEGGKDADWGIFQAANLGRECGLQIMLTTQSLENLYGLAPNYNENIAKGGLAGFPCVCAFRPGTPATSQYLQTLYGSEYREHLVLPASRYAEPTVKAELEPIVTDAEFASLGTGECIVKLLNCRPQRLKIHQPERRTP